MLGWELSHERGLVDDETFELIMAKYCVPSQSVPDLQEKVNRLEELAPEGIDAELVMAVFNCDMSAAQDALENVPTNTSVISESPHLKVTAYKLSDDVELRKPVPKPKVR
jgi:hypothetical protein